MVRKAIIDGRVCNCALISDPQANLDDFFLSLLLFSVIFFHSPTLIEYCSITAAAAAAAVSFVLFYCTALDCVSSIRFLDFSSVSKRQRYVHRFIKRNMFLKRRHGAINTHTNWNDFYAFFVQALKPLKQLK